MDEIVEKVARAIVTADGLSETFYDGLIAKVGDECAYLDLATAAIAAYKAALKDAGLVIVPREPTKAMWMAANRIPLDRCDLGEFAVTGYEAQDIWRAMITAAEVG